MIIYHATKAGFLADVFERDIEAVIQQAYCEATGSRVAPTQVRAWKESLFAMAKVLNHESIPDDCGLAVEYTIPQTAKRIDLLLSGLDQADQASLLIIELKQWEYALPTGSDGIVKTYMGGAEVETSHPSYQAWSYAELLRNFNEAVYTNDVPLQPCAYLHNFKDPTTLEGPAYAEYVEKAPFFITGQPSKISCSRSLKAEYSWTPKFQQARSNATLAACPTGDTSPGPCHAVLTP